MHVIRHYDEFVQFRMGEVRRYRHPAVLHSFADLTQSGMRIGDGTEDTTLRVATNCDEVEAR